MMMKKEKKHIRRIVAAVLFAFTLFGGSITLLGYPFSVFAAARTWDGGGGADTNWTTCANWSGDTCPVSGVDSVTFDVSSITNVTLNADISVSSITIAATYVGTVSQGVYNITTGSFSQAAGTFTGGSGTFDINGLFTLSGGTFTAPTGSMTVSGAWTHTAGGTFAHNNGSVTSDGNSGVTWNVATTETFYNFTVNKTGSTALIVASGDTLIATNSLTLTDGVLSTGGLRLTGATGSVASTWDGGAAASTLLIDGAGVQTFTLNGGGQEPAITLTVNNANATVGVAGSGTTVTSAVVLQAGVVNTSGFTHTNEGAYTQSGGTFTSGTGTKTFTGAFSQSAGAFNGDTATLDLDSSFTLSGGTFTATSGTMTVGGNWTHTAGGTFTHNSGTVNFDGGATNGTIDVATTETFYNFTFSKTGSQDLSTSASDSLIVTGTLTFSAASGSVINSNATLEARGNVVIASGVTATGAVAWLFSGTADQTITATGAEAAIDGTVTINKASGSLLLLQNLTLDTSGQDFALQSGTFNMNGFSTSVADDFTQSGGVFTSGGGSLTTLDFILSSGTFTAPPNMSVSGNWTHTAGGTFTHNSGTVNFDGGVAGGLIDVATTETFYNFTFSKTGGLDLSTSASDSLIVTGTLTFSAASGSVINANATLEAQGNVVIASGVTATGAVAWLFSGTADQTITATGAEAAIDGTVTINKASGSLLLLQNLTLDTSGQDFALQSGTFNMNGFSTSVADDFTQSGGVFTSGGGSLTTLDFILSSGTFTAPPNMSVSGNWTHTAGGTFTHNSGTVNFDGSATSGTIDVATTETFYNFTFSKTGGIDLSTSASDSLIVTGTLTFSAGSGSVINANATLEAQGGVVIASGVTATGAVAWLFSGTADQTITATGAEAAIDGTVTINKASGTVQLNSDLTLNGSSRNLILTSGTLYINGFNLTVNGTSATFVVSSGATLQMQGGETITTNVSYPQLDSGSTVKYVGTSGPYTLKDYTYHHLTVAGGASSVFVLAANESFGGNVTLTTGILSQGGFTMTVVGTFSNDATLRRLQAETFTGTMDVDSGTVEYVGDGDGAVETITITDFGGGGTDYYNLKVNDANVTKDIFALGAATTIAGTLQVTLSEFQQSSQTLTPANIIVDGGTLTGGSGAITVSGTVTISSGTFTSTSNTLTVSGAWTHTAGGTFTHNSGTVAFTGNSATVDVATSETFSALTLNKTNGQTLTIASGDTLVMVGTLTLTDGLADGNNFEAQGSVAIGAGYDGGTASLKFSGGAAQSLNLTGVESIFNGDIEVAKSAETLTLGSALTMDAVGQDLTITSGTFSTSGTNYGLTIAGDLLMNGGTTALNASTVAVTGTARLNGGSVTGSGGSMTAGTLRVTSGTYAQGTQTVAPTALVVDGGTFTGGGGSMTAGSITLSSGTLTAPSGTLTVTGGWTHTAGGTFTHNSGTVAFTGNSAAIDVSSTESFSALTINKTDGQTLTVASGDTLVAAGVLTLTDGAFATGSITAQGNVVVGAGWDAAGSGTVNATGSGTQTLDVSAGAGLLDNPLTINKAGGSFTLASAYTLDHANADLTLTLGTFSTGNFTLTTASGSDIAVNGGTINTGASTMTIAGGLTVAGGTYNGNDATPTFSGAVLLSSGAYNGSTNGDTFSGGLTISGGTFTASDATTTVSGAWTHTGGGTFTHNSGTVAFTGAAATIDVATTETFSTLTINKNNAATLTIASGDSLVSTGTLTLTNGAVGTGTLTPQGAVSVGAGFDGGDATLSFGGSSAQTFTLTGATDKYNGDITVAKASGTVTLGSALVMDAAGQDLTVTTGGFATGDYALTVAGNVAANGGTLGFGASTVDMNGNLTVGGGTLTLGTAAVTLAGGATYTSGTMTPNTSTVTLDGTSQTLAGATVWYNLTKNVTTAATLTFPSSVTTTIGGTLALTGAADEVLSIRSSTPGVQHTLSVATAGTYVYLNVMDSNPLTTLTCLTSSSGCVNAGNNASTWKFTTTSGGTSTPSLSGGAGSAGTVGDNSVPTTVGEFAELRVPTITLLAPNGGETYAPGESINILWRTDRVVDIVNVLVSYDNGASFETLVKNEPNFDVYTWTIPSSASASKVVMKVQGTDLSVVTAEDESDTVFAIAGTPIVTVDDGTYTDNYVEEITEIAERIVAMPAAVSVHELVKLADDGNPETTADSAVYYVGADGKRHAFPNQAIFNTWYCSFDDVEIISSDDMAAIALGANVTYRPGVRMVKFISVPKVYAVDRFGVLHWVKTEALATALYGDVWNKKIDDLSDAFFGNYEFGDDIESANDYDPTSASQAVEYPSDSIIIPGFSSEPQSEGLACS